MKMCSIGAWALSQTLHGSFTYVDSSVDSAVAWESSTEVGLSQPEDPRIEENVLSMTEKVSA